MVNKELFTKGVYYLLDQSKNCFFELNQNNN